METTQVRITETGTPSRSKQAGPCCAWLDADGERIFASAGGRVLEAEIGATLRLIAQASLRRASRTDRDREEGSVIVTGVPTDWVTISAGSPQSYDALVTGVRWA